MGGRNDSGFALWRAYASQKPRFYRGRGAHPGTRNRGEYRALHTLQCSRLATASAQRWRPDSQAIPERIREVLPRDRRFGWRAEQFPQYVLLSRIYQLSGQQSLLRTDCLRFSAADTGWP